MGTIRHLAAAIAIIAGLIPITTMAAQGHLALETPSLVFSDEPVQLLVGVDAFEAREADLVRANWIDYVELSDTDKDGNTRAVVVSSRSTSKPEITVIPPDAKGGQSETVWIARGIIVLAPLKPGTHNLTLKYRTVTSAFSLPVWKGDETDNLRAERLGRDLERKSYAFPDYKRIQLERLRLQPFNRGILLELGRHAQAAAGIDETDHYYADALAVTRAAIEKHKAAGDDVEGMLADASLFEARIAAVRTLLPQLYENQKGRTIHVDWMNGTAVELVDISRRQVLQSIRIETKARN